MLKIRGHQDLYIHIGFSGVTAPAGYQDTPHVPEDGGVRQAKYHC